MIDWYNSFKDKFGDDLFLANMKKHRFNGVMIIHFNDGDPKEVSMNRSIRPYLGVTKVCSAFEYLGIEF